MAKSKTSASVLTCDICGFKVANPYIFKRHLHKCFTLHGIASKRSTPRHPIRLKGTEGLKSSDNKLQDESFEGAHESSSKEEMDPLPHMSGSFGFGDEEEGSIASSVSSQWGVTNSPQVPVDTTLDRKEEAAMVTSEAETPSPTLPARAKFERKYSCETCPFETLKSRTFLYHLRDEHAEKLNIFECHLCDYASRYNNKLARHMSVHKKPGGAAFSVDPVILSTQRLRVKPIKLKRLSVKTSPEFEVSPTLSPKLSKVSPAASSMASPPSSNKISLESIKTEVEEQVPKPNKQKDVFKMVLAEDGSHRYQCRSCLFYANSPHSVKKHHVLCHSKVLNCSYCDYYTTEQAEYYEHILTHGGTGKLSFLKCEDCSYVTTARSNYEKHRSFHGADFPFHCTVCNFAAESESKVKRHMATQHTNSCSDVQDEVSFDGTHMALEMVDESSENVKREPVLNESQSLSSILGMEDDGNFQDPLHVKYRCPQCPIVCLRRGNFTRHLIARHNFTQASASQTSKTMERKLIRKRKLSVKLPLPQLISVKKRRQLVYSGENLKCSECSYTAKWPSDLRRHRLVHTIVKRFKCSMCNNKYKYAGDLNVHMRRDHLTEPQNIMAKDFVSSEVVKKASPALFRCPICPFSTHSKANLEQHSKQHKDIEKTFRCRLCKYQTYWRGDVGRHLFRHHGILLGKDPQEIENYFLHRPEIRPLTKQPHYNSAISKTSQLMNVESENGMSMDSHDLNGDLNSNSNETVHESAYKNTALVTGKEGQLVCSYVGCDYRTCTPERFEAHLAYHENLKQYVCPTCGKRTNWKWDIVKHMHKVHQDSTATNDSVVTLSLEEARATIGDYLLKREKKAGGIVVYLCSLCDFKSGDKSHVINHLAINHKEENGRVLNKYMPKSYVKRDLTSGNAQSESADHVGLSDMRKPDLFVDPPPEELAKMDKPFACALCQKAEISKAEVRKHYSYAHPYKDVRVIYTADGTEFDFNTNEIYSRKSDHLQEIEENSDSSNLKIVRHDSKYSNPKMHGYVKPFKCSICGLRSNWKWDLKKHLRAKHPNQGGFVIMLSIAEAKSTYAVECSPSHPKEVNRQPVYKLPSEQKPSSKLNPFKHPYRVKGETYDANYGIFGSLKGPTNERVTNFDPRRRQWKCSGCSYISNWRRNMARHIQRHHGYEKNKIRIIALHLLNKDSQQQFLTGQGSQDIKANENGPPVGPVKSNSNGSCRLWSCPKCSFQSNLRTHIIIHMQKHGMKPFLCGVCNTPFMNRGPLHRHIQKTHRRSDYIKLCKVNIDFGDVDTLENVFICCLCQLESKDKLTIIGHIEKEHNMKEYEYYIVTMQRKSHQDHTSPSNGVAYPDKQIRSRRIHQCQLCPFRSQKKSMLVFHMTYHKPTPANRFKCKYCPYYVSTSRLLHQHQRKWHTDNNRHIEGGTRGTGWEQMQSTPPVSPLKQGGQAGQITTSRRHYCEKCPYTTNSKNDFLYHKQFHRPKRTAEYKCEYCDYWVVHKRLLKQHMRLHTKASHEPEVSPVKSVYSDPGLVYDPVELTELAAIKQQMISAKITPSLSKSPKFSPMKMATKLSVDDKPGYVLKNGLYRKLHKCRRCPYTNTRARNMQLHEMMHGPRQCSYPLMKCPYCDYYVGSKGLLSHHMKVHLKNYGDTPENDAAMANFGTTDDDDGSDTEIQTQQKVDTLLSISRFKRFGCEKCPYASAKRQHFERHLELHGSRQRYTCQYCDYSVPSSYLLTQHSKLHLMPNQNLLASQSITNLQYMSEVPADVALASALPPTDRDMPVTISVIHDHLGLYENSIYDSEPKKLYRCDRCPYANVRRDYLLSHLKFHMVPSALVCPYCDYSAPKQALLIQHIRVHFCPLPELSDWLLENGQTERETSQRNIDLAEALKVAHEYQNQSKKRSKGGKLEAAHNAGKDENTEEKENVEEGQGVTSSQTLICQYCDREFSSSEKLVKHELQHLIGNQFEMALKSVSEDQQQNTSSKQSPKPDPNGEAAEMKEDSEEPMKDDLQGTNPDESLTEEKGGRSPVKLEITGDDSLNLELSMDTNISDYHDLSGVESHKEKEDAPDLETGNKAEVEEKEVVDKEIDNEMEKPMEECSDIHENTHTNEAVDGHKETIAEKEPQDLKPDTENIKVSPDNTKTHCETETGNRKDSEVFQDITSDPDSSLKKTRDEEVEKDDTEQDTTIKKNAEKSEGKLDSKEEITDVIDEIEKLLGDDDTPKVNDTSIEEDFKMVRSSTPSKGNHENDLKEAKEENLTLSEETKDVKEPENEDKEDDGWNGSEEKMETSDIDTQGQVEQEKGDNDGKSMDDLTEKPSLDTAKELEPMDSQSGDTTESGKEGSGDNVMEDKSGEEIVESECKNSNEEKKKEDDDDNGEKVTDDAMEKESFTQSQESAAEEVNSDDAKKESAEEGLEEVDNMKEQSTVPEEADESNEPNGDKI